MKINVNTVAVILTSPLWVPAFAVGLVIKVVFIGLKAGFDLVQP